MAEVLRTLQAFPEVFWKVVMFLVICWLLAVAIYRRLP